MFRITCEGLVIGYSAFEIRGLPRTVVRGRFEPTAEYTRVRPLFRADAIARARPSDDDAETVLKAYYTARDQLHFEVTDPNGRSVPVDYVHVYEPSATEASQAVYEVVARLAVPASEKTHRQPRRPAT